MAIDRKKPADFKFHIPARLANPIPGSLIEG
jgi:hypothetical protein